MTSSTMQGRKRRPSSGLRISLDFLTYPTQQLPIRPRSRPLWKATFRLACNLRCCCCQRLTLATSRCMSCWKASRRICPFHAETMHFPLSRRRICHCTHHVLQERLQNFVLSSSSIIPPQTPLSLPRKNSSLYDPEDVWASLCNTSTLLEM